MSGTESLFHALDRRLRIIAEFFFGPMYDWRFTRWLIARRGGNPDDYAGIPKVTDRD